MNVNELYLSNARPPKLVKKLAGYKQQDQRFDIYSASHFITMDSVLEKLVAARMKCTHCLSEMLLDYSARDMRQWTLDRIDNRYGHNSDNVVVCCLQCNLKRRNTNLEKFRFTKQLKLIKVS